MSTASAKTVRMKANPIEEIKDALHEYALRPNIYGLAMVFRIERAIKLLEAPPATERTALEKVRALRERLDNWVRQFETANPGSPALRYTRQAWKVVRDEIDFRFPELDAQERAEKK